MTLYEIVNGAVIHGNVSIIVYDDYFEVVGRYDIYAADVLSTFTIDEWAQYEDYKVLFVFAEMSPDGSPRLVIEIMEVTR